MNNPVFQLLVALLIAAGLFFLLRISPKGYLKRCGQLLNRQTSTHRRRREIITGVNKKPLLLRYFAKARAVLLQSGNGGWFPAVQILGIFLAVAGVFMALSMNNLLLVPVFAASFGLFPFAVVHLMQPSLADDFNRNMKSALGVITNAYIQNDDVILAAKSVLELLNPPFTDVFREFVAETTLIEANVSLAVRHMSAKVDNRIFHEWCDMLIQCQDNKELKFALPPIVEKIDDTITVQAELNTQMSRETGYFYPLLLINLASLPAMALLRQSLYQQLAANPFGKFMIFASLAVVFAMFYYAVKTLEPIEYR